MFYDNAGAPVRKHYTLDEFGVGTGAGMGAAFKQSLLEAFSSATWRDNELIRANIGEGEVHYGAYSPSMGHSKIISGTEKKLTHEQAQTQIVDSGLPLTVPDEGFTQKALDIVMERKREELVRKKQMDDATGFVATGGKFAAGMVAQVLDPVNIAASFVPVIGPTKYAAWIAAQTSAAGRAGVRAVVGAVEGLAGAAIVEPAIYQAMTREQADYTMADSLINVGLGTVLGGGLHMGMGAASDAFKRTGSKTLQQPQGTMAKAVDSADPATRDAMLKTSLQMEAQGYKLDVTSVAAADTNLNAVTKAMKQEQSPKVYYHGTTKSFSMFDPSKAGARGANFGDAVYVTSDPSVASGYSVNLTGSKEYTKLISERDRLSTERNLAAVKYGKGSDEHLELQKKVDKVNSQRQALQDKINNFEHPTEGSNVMPVRVSGNILTLDAKGKSWGEVNEGFIKEARDKGFDGVEIKNVVDSATAQTRAASDIVAVFDSSNVRSSFENSIMPPHVDESQAMQNSISEGFSTTNKRGVDKPASIEADKKLSTAERSLDEEMVDLEDFFSEYQKMTGDDTSLKVYDDAIAKAETDATALKAATMCRLTK